MILIVSSLITLGLPFLPLPESAANNFLLFLGRFHPLILHFPIVLVLLLAGLEVNTVFRKKSSTAFTKNLLILSLISTFLTVLIGFFLYQSGDYQGQMVRQHLWGAVLLNLSLSAATFAFWQTKTRFYQASLFLSVIILLYTSHIGGSITHGPDFLTEYMPSLKAPKAAPVEAKAQHELLVFEDLIMPALEDRCQSCHNAYKTKGGLLLTSYEDIQKGGKSGKPMLVSQNANASELYHRIILPMDDDEHMPPAEKPALSEEEIVLIQWWIQKGAAFDMQVGQNPPDSISVVLQNYLPELYQAERLKLRQTEEQEALAKELADFGQEIGLVIEPDPASTAGHFAVSMQIPPAFVDNSTLEKLRPYAALFSKVSLPGAEITEDGLFVLSKMPNLKHLYLPKTCIKGQGLPYLKSLEKLEAINLSHTFLNNEGILNLSHLPQVKTVYIFRTNTDTLVLNALRKNLATMNILDEEGPYY